MRLLRLAMRWKLTVAMAASASVAVLVTGALASPSRPAAGVTFQLVEVPTCTGGTKRLGHACVNRSEIPTWTTIADGSAKNDVPGQWLTTYSWTPPQTVPAAGAVLTLKAEGEERTGRANARICPAISARSGFTFKGETQPAGVGVCAEAVTKPKAGGTKTLTLLPANAAPGSTVTLTIYVQYALEYTYTYRAVAAKKKKKKRRPLCRRPQTLSATQVPRAFTGMQKEPQCKWTVKYNFHTEDRQGRTAVGYGTLTGTNLKDLKPANNYMALISPPKAGLAANVQLTVLGGSYAHPFGGREIVVLSVSVHASTATPAYECPKGAQFIVTLVQREVGIGGNEVRAKDCPNVFPNDDLVRNTVNITWSSTTLP
jgi:hypothetical protein